MVSKARICLAASWNSRLKGWNLLLRRANRILDCTLTE